MSAFCGGQRPPPRTIQICEFCPISYRLLFIYKDNFEHLLIHASMILYSRAYDIVFASP